MKNIKQKIISNYNCNICNKDYLSYQSLWNHNQKKHNINHHEIDKCKYCDKIFNRKDNLVRHNKICKIKKEHDDINSKLDEIKLEELKLKQLDAKNKNLELQIKLAKLNGNTINNTINNNCIINNNVFIKYNDISYDTLTKQERNEIFNSYNMIEESIKKIHFNPDKPDQNNIYITNLKDLYCTVFTGTQFSALLKHDFLPDLIDLHLFELCLSKDKYKLKDSISQKINVLEKRISKDDKKYTDENDKVFTPLHI
jgi:hypothetical protein